MNVNPEISSLGANLDAVFKPRSIAVIGASANAIKIGGRPIHLLKSLGFEGAIYPINPKGGEVQGLPAYRSVAELPATPDLAIVAIGAELVPDAVEQCAAAGVKAAVILSSGFAELGENGTALQRRLTEIARDSGIRLLGPNCLGAVDVQRKTIASFSVVLDGGLPAAGSLGIISQSGNLGSYLLLLARERSVGVSGMLTTGNESDIDVADGIAWMTQDPRTQVILCCLETCRSSARFTQALQMARAAGKPVVVLKIGTSEIGRAAAASHTGALAGSDAVFDAVLRRHGAVRVASVEELLSVGHAASILGTARLPAGRRVALVAASGGFGVMLADAASAAGLTVPTLAAKTQSAIRTLLPNAATGNPVDTTAQISSNPEFARDVFAAIAADESCDSVIILLSASLFVPRLRSVYVEAFAALRHAAPHKPIMLCIHGPFDAMTELNKLGFPTIDGIDAICRVTGALCDLSALLRMDPAPAAAPAPLAPLAPDTQFSDEASAKKVLGEAGLPFLPERITGNVDEAAAAAAALGFPVVIKILSADIPHKTEVGGVVVGLKSADEVRAAAAAMLLRVAAARPSAHIDGILVAPMAEGICELIVGATTDPLFGPVVMVGLGGIFAEIFEDVRLEPAPVSKDTALEMLRSLRSYPLLDGARGRPRADIDAVADAVAALSRFAAANAQVVSQIDINPLLVRAEGQGAVALDALIVPAVSTKV